MSAKRSASGQRRKVAEAKHVVQLALGDAARRDEPRPEKYLPTKTPEPVPLKSEAIGVLFPGEVAARLGITEDEVRRMIARGRMKSLTVGGLSVVVPSSEVERLNAESG